MSTVAPTKLKEVASGDLVDSELHTSLVFTDIIDAEQAWATARLEMLRQCYLRGEQPPQHLHWNWATKLLKKGRDIGGALSPYRLMGINGPETWQGLVLATCVGRTTKTNEGGKDLVYIDYLEAAPWNLAVPEANQEPRFRGVGRQLMELCVRVSLELELKGRIGLHALPQADGFYQRCGMTDLGPDGDYHDLRYFEMTEEQAEAFLTPRRTD